jgi:hypothetical protein
MDLSMKQRAETKMTQYDKRFAEGSCTYCGIQGHYRADCRKKKEAILAANAAKLRFPSSEEEEAMREQSPPSSPEPAKN